MLDNDPVKAYIIDSYLANCIDPSTVDWAIKHYYNEHDLNKPHTWSYSWKLAYEASGGVIPKKKEVKTERRIINPESVPTV